MQHKQTERSCRKPFMQFRAATRMKTKPNKVVQCVTRKRRWLTLLRDPFSFRFSLYDRQSSRLMIVRSLCFFDKKKKNYFLREACFTFERLIDRNGELLPLFYQKFNSQNPKLSKKRSLKDHLKTGLLRTRQIFLKFDGII